ncbi:MAG: SDR family NAD(P)-dependent oxidoreductase, partial [Clostridiales Family XIII bacterium]|nr:SDR family NAD(P)-dependent oxidoreductase [Clostridiales Family XIII bacterium]
MANLFDLSGKIAVVTGASSGLGAGAAVAYAEYGADVALLARRSDKLLVTAEKIEAFGRKALPVTCDIAKEKSVAEAIRKIVNHFGRIDILLNNAGIALSGTVEEITLADWDKIVGTNMTGMYLVSKYAVPVMRQGGGGKIVNTASVNAIIADKPAPLARHAYNATKSGVRGLTIGMAASYGADNITVNSINPGLFESEMTENTLFKIESFMQDYSAQNPMGRPGMRGELNGTILYLSSAAS